MAAPAGSTTRHSRHATRIAVIGMGTWGRQLIRVFDSVAHVVVAANRGGEAGHAWLRGSYPTIRPSSDALAAIADPSVEAVVIATSIASHASLAIAALDQGKHVFVEKPLATSGVEAGQVVASARSAGRALFVGHTFLFDAAFEALHGLVREDPIERIDLTWLKYGTFVEPLVWNLLPHEVSLAAWLVGMVPSLRVIEQRPGETPLDRLVADLDFGPGGPDGTITIDRQHGAKMKSAVVRTRSGNEFRWQNGDLDRMRGDRPIERLVEHSEESLVREARAFLQAVSGGANDRSDGEFGAAIVRVIEPIAIQSGQRPPMEASGR
jgi:predicted dehydrogenase